jgi:hypothetical protein
MAGLPNVMRRASFLLIPPLPIFPQSAIDFCSFRARVCVSCRPGLGRRCAGGVERRGVESGGSCARPGRFLAQGRTGCAPLRAAINR